MVVIGEWLRHKKLITNEASRKIIHISHTLVVAGWPFFVGYRWIILAELVFVGIVLAVQRVKFFRPLWLVGRKSWGELFLPAGVILMCLIEPPAWVFAIALLHVGLADTMAALVGQRVKSRNYTILGQRKSVVGSLVFAMCSVVIILLTLQFLTTGFSPAQITAALIIIPVVTTFAENLSVYGLDNLTVPLTVVWLIYLLNLA